MNQPASLTQENFWNNMESLYPGSCKNFYEVFENHISESKYSAILKPGVKYQELPYSFQLVIWCELVAIHNDIDFAEAVVNLNEFSLADDIEQFFIYIIEPNC